MTQGIYLITNKINGRQYVGQSVHIEKRWTEHILESKKDDPAYLLHKALHKYGKDNFYFDIIIKCPKDMLDVWETDMINLYNCAMPNGYNMVRTGKGCSDRTRILNSERLKKENPMFNKDTVEKVRSKLLGTHHNRVTEYQREVSSKRMKENNPMKNKDVVKSVSDKLRGRKQSRERVLNNLTTKYTHILQYDLDGNFIKEWELVSDIVKELHLKKSILYAALNNRQKTAGGFIWKFI